MIKIKAVLSTTVLPLDGTYRITTTTEVVDIEGVPHYIGHPDTKELVESMGSIQAECRLFDGLQIGEVAVCFPITQGRSNRKVDGFSSPHQAVELADLSVRLIERIG